MALEKTGRLKDVRYQTVRVNAAPLTDLATTDLAYFRIPAAYNGMSVVSVTASIGNGVAGHSTGAAPAFMVKNVRSGLDILSTAVTVDASEYSSATAAVPVVINPANKTVLEDDLIEVECTVAGTAADRAIVTIGFQSP